MSKVKTEHRVTQHILAMALGLCAVTAQAGVTTIGATTVTNTVDFHRGVLDYFLGYYWSYNYKVTTSVNHNDIHIGFVSGSDMVIGSYSGDGGGTPSFAGNTLVINSPVAMPGTMSFHIDTIRNAGSVTGSQAFALSQNGAIIPGTTTTLPSAPAISTGFLQGFIVLDFLAGTFNPFADIDLFQNGQITPYIGYGQANADGSARISVAHPLIGGSDLLISQNGRMAFSASVIAEPESLWLVLMAASLGLTSMLRKPSNRLQFATAMRRTGAALAA